jgi:hypothetical protein
MTRDNEILSIDVSDSTQPAVVNVFSTFEVELELWRDGLVLVSGPDFQLLDTTNPVGPQPIATIPAADPRCIDVSGSLGWISEGSRGARLVDLSEPLIPVQVGQLLPPSYDVQIVANHAFVVSNAGLLIYDVADPQNPGQVASLPARGGSGGAVAVRGHLAAYFGNTSEIVLADVSDPMFPQPISAVLVSNSRQFRVGDDRLYVGSESGLEIFDTSNPSAPVSLGFFAAPDSMWYFTIDRDLLYAMSNDGFYIVDVSGSIPVTVGWGEVLSHIEGVEKYGDVLAIATYRRGIELWSVEDPANPRHLASTYAPVQIEDFEIQDGIAYSVSRRAESYDVSCVFGCYADCNHDNRLDVFDFLCFQDLFQGGDPAADCDDSGHLDVFDFLCFQDEFIAGCD